jgi:transcriptional regulator with XRE-family HTH domain
MTLDEFRIENGWSYSELARQLGASHATAARRWCLDKSHPDYTIPRKLFMDRIVKKSFGKVLPNSFYLGGS